MNPTGIHRLLLPFNNLSCLLFLFKTKNCDNSRQKGQNTCSLTHKSKISKRGLDSENFNDGTEVLDTHTSFRGGCGRVSSPRGGVSIRDTSDRRSRDPGSSGPRVYPVGWVKRWPEGQESYQTHTSSEDSRTLIHSLNPVSGPSVGPLPPTLHLTQSLPTTPIPSLPLPF